MQCYLQLSIHLIHSKFDVIGCSWYVCYYLNLCMYLCHMCMCTTYVYNTLIFILHIICLLCSDSHIYYIYTIISFYIQRDLKALGKSVEVLSQESPKLSGLYPESADLVITIEKDIGDVWNRLMSRTKDCKGKLLQAEQLQLFLNEYRT